MIDLRAWPKKWNDSGLREIAILPENATSRLWPMLGMLVVGLVLGTALGAFAASQRWPMERLAMHGDRMDDEVAPMDRDGEPTSASERSSLRSNHRRKATSEV